MGIISGLGSFWGQFGDHFRVGDHFGVGIISGAVHIATKNRPFPNYLWPLFQSESWCSSFHMKISFDSHANEN